MISGLATEDSDLEHGVWKSFFYNADELNNVLGHKKVQYGLSRKILQSVFGIHKQKVKKIVVYIVIITFYCIITLFTPILLLFALFEPHKTQKSPQRTH